MDNLKLTLELLDLVIVVGCLPPVSSASFGLF